MPDDDIDLERREAFARDLGHTLYHTLLDWLAANEPKGVKPGEVLAGLALFGGTGLAFLALRADLPDPGGAGWTHDYETVVRHTMTEALAAGRRRRARKEKP